MTASSLSGYRSAVFQKKAAAAAIGQELEEKFRELLHVEDEALGRARFRRCLDGRAQDQLVEKRVSIGTLIGLYAWDALRLSPSLEDLQSQEKAPRLTHAHIHPEVDRIWCLKEPWCVPFIPHITPSLCT